MQIIYPTSIQSPTNGTLELFTGIFYVIRILGAGNGLIRPSAIPSANGGIYLEQDIFANGKNTPDALWYFEPAPTSNFYEWGLQSEPKTKVSWSTGDTEEDDYPIQLRNSTEISQDFYEDPTSTFWEFVPFPLENLGLGKSKTGYKVRPMNLQVGNGASLTFTPSPRSPRGWWLQVNNHPDDMTQTKSEMADHLVIFEPTSFKLYADIQHMDIGEISDLFNSSTMEKKLVKTIYLENPTSNTTTEKISFQTEVEYDVFVKADKGYDLFQGITITNPKTMPSIKYFDLEDPSQKDLIEDSLNLKCTQLLTVDDEVNLEPFSKKRIDAFVTYIKSFKGIRYFSWTDVSAVADIMGRDGKVIRNVLVRNEALLKNLIRSRGYNGDFKQSPSQNELDGAKIRIKVHGIIRGSIPIPFIQFDDN